MLQIIKSKGIKFITKFYDPLVKLKIGNQTILVPLSHQLHKNVRIHPDYNFNLPRVIGYVSAKYPDVKVIDIGANIGDTAAFIKNYSDAPILCIDGEKKYLDILKKNVAKYKNVSICNALVGEKNMEANVSMKMERGTAEVVETDQKTSIRTLDSILEEFPNFKNAKVLKTDTDGYDTLILRGCSRFLKSQKPILFFEFDPFLIHKNNDDPAGFISYLKDCGYGHLMFYMNNGDFLLSCSTDQTELINQLVDYFSGRNIFLFADICAFHLDDAAIFKVCVEKELAHFKKARSY